MEKEYFNEVVAKFFKALEEKTILIIIDSASKADKAVFSLVYFREKNNPCYGFENLAPMLRELGFKNYRNETSLFVTHCAGRFSLFILDNIGQELKRKGIELPDNYHALIQSQNVI